MRQLALRLVLALSAAAPVTSVHAAACGDALFVDQVAPAAWHTIELQPSQGTAGLRAALQSAGRDHADVPVRIRLAAGRYADNIGSEVFAQRLQRSASAPIHIVAADPRPNATVLGHGLNLLGVSYIAIEGLTIGPEQVGAWDGQRHADPQPLQAAAGVHVAGAALEARRNAAAGSAVDFAIYGRYEPSHHIVVRRVTVQNLFGSDERDGETSESQNMDGMKFNQVQDLWVLDSRVDQTTRHGIDLVGVHRAAICRTLISRSGGGLGIEAKGGSVDVLYDSNTFYRVRRVELGGEDTDATYYMSADGRWDYEALRTVARHNLVIDAREAALEFSGCLDCTAIGNTVYFSAAYRPPGDGQDIQGGDAIRVHDSRVLAAEDGAGSDCQTWDPNLQDYVTVDPCWGVGARPPAPVNRVLRSDRLTLVNNLFMAENALFGSGGGAVVPCPLNVVGGNASMTMDGNLWWNGGRALPAEGCSTLPEGAGSKAPSMAARPLVGGAIDSSTLDRLIASVTAATLPVAGSELRSLAVAHPSQGAHDRLGAPRAGTTGAHEGPMSDADRLFNWAQATYPGYFTPASGSQWLAGYYLRHYPATGTYLGTAGARVYLLSPLIGPEVLDLGPLADWLSTAFAAGY